MSAVSKAHPSQEGQPDSADALVRKLDALVLDNPTFDQLEFLLKKFNIFAALRLERQEIRHSNFLAWLLAPGQNHGLGDKFLKRFLQVALAGSADTKVSRMDIHLSPLDDTEVLTEWRSIDILLRSRSAKLVALIENKIDSSEHSNQLQRYMDEVGREREFDGWERLGLYLTRDGESPSDERWIPLTYARVCKVVEELSDLPLDREISFALRHYSEMLRRYVVEESKISHLCRELYEKHQKALDLIYEHRPDRQQLTRRFLENQIKDRPTELQLKESTNTRILFALRSVDVFLARQTGQTTDQIDGLLLFGFDSKEDELDFVVRVGPVQGETRRKLLETACAKPSKLLDVAFGKPFKGSATLPVLLKGKWNTIFSHCLMDAEKYRLSEKEFQVELQRQWDDVIRELPKLEKAIMAVFPSD